jgi:hypothetical protein
MIPEDEALAQRQRNTGDVEPGGGAPAHRPASALLPPMGWHIR